MAELSLPPASAPISDGRGFAPLAWRRFFDGVFQRLGGAVDHVAIAYGAARDAAAAGNLTGVAAVADAAYAGVGVPGSFPSGVDIVAVPATGTVIVTGNRRNYILGGAAATVMG